VTANAAVVPAGANGSISVYSSDQTDLVIDINGYFAPAASGGLSCNTMAPCRAVDMRYGGSASPVVGSTTLGIAGSTCNAPTTPAYLLNVTVVSPGYLGFLTLWATGGAQPLVSTLNSSGGVASNMAIVPASNGEISAYTSQAAYLILDVYGYFAP
jgi:hypothetical protein